MKKYLKIHHQAPAGTFCNSQENKATPKEEALMKVKKRLENGRFHFSIFRL